MNRYLLALIVPAVGPWIVWPGAELCEKLWGKVEGVVFLVVALSAVVVGVIQMNDRLPRYNFWFILIQFVVFWASVFFLKYVSYLLI